jgi:NitT/TauT family transport system ATP-binding protein
MRSAPEAVRPTGLERVNVEQEQFGTGELMRQEVVPDRGEVADASPQASATNAAAGLDIAVELRNVSQKFSTRTGTFTALENVNLAVRRGEFLSVVGPSGCGKSTLLTLIAGMVKPTSGSVHVLGKQVEGMVPEIGFAFQRDALLPWRTALDNVALPLRFRGMGRRESRDRAGEWLDRVGLGSFHDRYPYQLSGGMRKRVGIATALVYGPSVLLMDEPFSALDVQTRNLMEDDLLALWAETGQTVVFITHDLEEAVGLSDRVVVMSASPGSVVNDYPVSLARPRNLLDIRSYAEFGETYGLIWSDLRSEVLKASAPERAEAKAKVSTRRGRRNQ